MRMTVFEPTFSKLEREQWQKGNVSSDSVGGFMS